MALKKKKAAKKPRNRKAQEATLINNDARKKEIAALKRAVAEINSQLRTPRWKQIEERLDNQERTIVGLQKTVLQLVEEKTSAKRPADDASRAGSMSTSETPRSML